MDETTAYGAANTLNQYVTVTQGASPAVTLTHDVNGNLTGEGTWAFAYDSEKRLRTATRAGTVASYLYDPAGRRQAKVVNSVVTSFLSDGAEEIAEYTGAGGLLRRYVPGPGTDQPIAMITPVGAGHMRSYFHVNRQGSTVAMSNDAGTVSEGPYTYDAYGQGASSAGVPFKYTGRRLDPETGLYYYRARYYSASLGRFAQTDPIGYGDDMNMYAYVGGDPVNMVDPSGRNAVSKLIKQTIKHKGNVLEALVDVGDMVVTVFAPESTSLERIVALAELVSPVSPSDVKDAQRVLEGVSSIFKGRKGGLQTRAQNEAIGAMLEAKGVTRTGGGHFKPETHFPSVGPGNAGGRFSDNSFVDAHGRFQVQTVNTNRAGQITSSERAAAADIAERSNTPVVCIPKSQRKGACN